jgi:hypothetical protein
MRFSFSLTFDGEMSEILNGLEKCRKEERWRRGEEGHSQERFL